MSGSAVPYHLRVNKYVERRLFLETLALVGRFRAVSRYAYISMGGAYLEDFRVIHQAFGIRAMLSFDMDDWVIGRQLINRPYGFIRCEKAKSGEIIDRFDEERESLVGAEGNVILWLDYTEPDQRYDQLSDLQRGLGKLIHGDVFRITLNAYRATFGTADEYLLAKKTGETKHKTVEEWWHEKLADQLNVYLPEELNNSACMDSDSQFASTLVQAIRMAAQKGLASRPELVIEPLLIVRYSDSRHQMLTLTGLVLRELERFDFRDRVQWTDWPFKPGEDWENCVCLAVPHLSTKERHLIHKMMYFEWENPADLLEFRVHERANDHAEMVNQYIAHCRRYPTFAPADIF